MNTKSFLTIQAFISLLFAISMIFMSEQMTQRYMMDISWENPATNLIRKGMGALLLGIACGSWMAKDAIDSPALRGWILSSVVGNLLLIVFHLNAISSGVEKPFAWVSISVNALFVVWGSMLFIRKK